MGHKSYVIYIYIYLSFIYIYRYTHTICILTIDYFYINYDKEIYIYICSLFIDVTMVKIMDDVGVNLSSKNSIIEDRWENSQLV